MKYSVFILFTSVSFLSFSQKKILKQAIAYEESGIYELAAEKYMEALHQNATKSESIHGLKRTSQKVVDQKLANYFISRNSSDLETALTLFEEITSYRDRLKYFAVVPNIPNYYFNDYESDKVKLIRELKEQ